MSLLPGGLRRSTEGSSEGPFGWDGLERLIERCDVNGIVAALAALDEPARRALAEPLRGYERARRAAGRQDGEWSSWRYEAWSRRDAVLPVAAAGVLPVSALVPVLSRAEWDTQWTSGPDGRPVACDTQESVVQVLADRGGDWIPAVLDRLTDRLTTMAWPLDVYRLIRHLLRHTGGPPPDNAVFRRLWFDHLSPCLDDVRHELEAGPGWPEALRDVIGLDRVGLSVSQFREWVTVLVRLADEGLVDRAGLLDAVLGRLQRPERPGDLPGALALHDALAPTDEEVAARTADYLGILPGGASVAATAAVRRLRAADKRGGIAPEAVLEAAGAVLVRHEKGLVTAQLGWLGEAARRRGPSALPATAVVEAACLAFRHPSAEVQARALTLALRHLGQADPLTVEAVREAATDLPFDLRERAVEATGGATARVSGSDASQTVAPVVAPAPVGIIPIGSGAEAAEELAALLDAPFGNPLDAVRLERFLAALVSLAHTDRLALREALSPVTSRSFWFQDDAELSWANGSPLLILRDAVRAATGPAAGPAWTRFADLPPGARPKRERRRKKWERAHHPLIRALFARLREIALGLAWSPVPHLLSTPTTSDGLLDQDVLLDRLAVLPPGRAWPWPEDLALALLRIPPGPHPAAAARVRREGLGGPQSQALAGWLESGGIAPRVEPYPLQEWILTAQVGYGFEPFYPPHVLASIQHEASLGPLLTQPWGEVFSCPRPEDQLQGVDYLPGSSVWAGLLPGYPDVVAAHVLPALVLHCLERGSDDLPTVLPLLAGSPGRVGPGLALAVGYGLGAVDAAHRLSAVDALLVLAARGEPLWPELGRALGQLLDRRAFPIGRVVGGLRDVGRSGAWPQVWQLLEAALPAVLPAPGEAPLTALNQLLALAVEAADGAGARAGIEGLDALAGRGGSSRAVSEARRLRQVLAR